MTDGPRRRDPHATAQTLVPEWEVRLAIESAKQELRREFVANIDRQALERAIDDAREAAADAKEVSRDLHAARSTSARRWVTILVTLGVLAVLVAVQHVYSRENRARLELLERARRP